MSIKPIIALIAISAIAACSSPETVSDADKVEIDCLAAKTVIEVTDAAKAAIIAGKSTDELRALQDGIIEAGADTLSSKFPGNMHEAYYEFEAKRRLTAMQNAVANRAPNSPDQQTMDETIDLAKSCSF